MTEYTKKIALLFSLAVLVCTFAHAPEAKAGPGKAIAITGLVLGGSALGLAAYNTYQNRRYRNDGYYDQRRNVGYAPAGYRRPCPRNNNYYGNSYNNGGYYGNRYRDYNDRYGY